MKFPFISRNRHRATTALLRTKIVQQREVISAQADEILVLQEKVSAQEQQISGFLEVISKGKVYRDTSEKPKTTQIDDSGGAGRAGWRTMASHRSSRTMPQPKDSVEALEQRVSAEGGTV